MDNCSFLANSAVLGGGSLSLLQVRNVGLVACPRPHDRFEELAALVQGYSLSVTGSSFLGSSAPLGGAVALANGSALALSGATFSGCQASFGGAVYSRAPTQAQLQAILAPPFPTSLANPSTVYTYGRQMGSALSMVTCM